MHTEELMDQTPVKLEVTFDYRCPFARNGNEAVINAIRERALTNVQWRFMAFSLDQVHIEEGAAAVWERAPADWGSGVLALLYGIAIRDAFPKQFHEAHLALFAARHDHGRKLDDEQVLRDAVTGVGLDADAVARVARSDATLQTLAKEHTEAVDRWGAFGVPTYALGDDAAFVRFMERGHVADLVRMVELLTWTRLNEFKRPRVPR
jgi:predicted DsbA family dithiol-disulfide isomerase